MPKPKIVSREKWIKARKKFLEKEKKLTRARDKLAKERRKLPWETVTKKYVFESAKGKETLADLFGGKSQLVIYHFMFAPEWEAACKSCSFWADNFQNIDIHLAHRDTAFMAISRAPFKKLEAYRKRMGWKSKFVSSYGNDFNYDYDVSFKPQDIRRGKATHNYAKMKMSATDMPGISVFYKDKKGKIFHTYSCYMRGIDLMNTAYNYLDLTPKGRDEAHLAHTMAWVKRHDEYGT